MHTSEFIKWHDTVHKLRRYNDFVKYRNAAANKSSVATLWHNGQSTITAVSQNLRHLSCCLWSKHQSARSWHSPMQHWSDVNLNFKDYMMFICSKIIKSALATTGFKDTEHTRYLYTLVLLVAEKTKMIFWSEIIKFNYFCFTNRPPLLLIQWLLIQSSLKQLFDTISSMYKSLICCWYRRQPLRLR